MKINFEGHHGELMKSDGSVIFYDLIFDDILHARKFLQLIPPGNYTGWIENKYFGVTDVITGESIKVLGR
jgi:hypothetical protein